MELIKIRPGQRAIACLLLLSCITLFKASAVKAADVLDYESVLVDSWSELHSQHFIFFSQLSARKTRQIAMDLERWRNAAAQLIDADGVIPSAAVANQVYLFKDSSALAAFSGTGEAGFFVATPRANYIALVDGDDDSRSAALHYYAHFLLRNFSTLNLPRWYEEAMAAYLARITTSRSGPELERFSAQQLAAVLSFSDEISMQRLLYENTGLASPRYVSIASIKSAMLLHYLLHGYQETDFVDRRGQLQRYLALLEDGRRSRFAYDRAFDISVEQLDEEYKNYLTNTRRPAGLLASSAFIPENPLPATPMKAAEAALKLAELALNAANFQVASQSFQAVIDSDDSIARAYSGLGDALRMQTGAASDQQLEAYFDQALALAPQDGLMLLDYGEHFEALLSDCSKQYPAAQRERMLAAIEQAYQASLELNPDSAEANLAMAQFFLFDAQAWQQGIEYQQKAYALLPGDSFVTEQAVKYAIASKDYDRANVLIDELAQPLHFWSEPGWIEGLRQRLRRHRLEQPYDECESLN